MRTIRRQTFQSQRRRILKSGSYMGIYVPGKTLKGFRAHADALTKALLLIGEFYKVKFWRFLPEGNSSWGAAGNHVLDPRAKHAKIALLKLGIKKSFNGAIELGPTELRTYLPHLLWLQGVHVVAGGLPFCCYFCDEGNLHLLFSTLEDEAIYSKSIQQLGLRSIADCKTQSAF